MGFLNSLFLIGLGAAVLPILIHLLARQKAKRVLFGSVEFIRRLDEKRRRRFRLTQLFLLALRVLLLALIALGFARPTFRHSLFGETGRGRTAAVIVLDASASMGGAMGGVGASASAASAASRTTSSAESPFEAARRRALDVVDLLSDDDESAVLLATALPRGPTQSLTRTRDLLRDEIARAAPTAAASDLATALRDAARLLADARSPNRELYVISDFQKNTLPESGFHLAMPPGMRTYLLPVAHDDRGNAAITAVACRETRLGSGELAVEAEVARFGGNGALETLVTLAIDGVERERRLVSVEPGEKRAVAFTTRVETRGFHEGVVTCDAKDLAIDNARPFVIGLSEGIRVLVVDGRGRSERGSAYFVGRALSPEPSAAGFFRVTRVGAVEEGLPDLAPYGAVVLADVARLSESNLGRLAAYLDKGGGVLVLPGRTLDAASYSKSLLPRLGLSARIATPPVEFAGSFARVDEIAEGHAIFAPFGESRRRLFRETKIFRHFPVEVGQGSRSIARFGGGAAAIVEADRASGGRALLATFPIDPEWTTLPRDPVFVPILHEMMKFLARVESPEAMNLVVGAPYRRVVTDIPDGESIVAVAPDGSETLVSPRSEAAGLVAEVRETALAGIYTLRTPSAEYPFAVAVDPRESDLAPLSPSEISEAFPKAESVAPSAEIRRAVLAGRFGREYWRPVLFAALLVAIAESLAGRGAWRGAAGAGASAGAGRGVGAGAAAGAAGAARGSSGSGSEGKRAV